MSDFLKSGRRFNTQQAQNDLCLQAEGEKNNETDEGLKPARIGALYLDGIQEYMVHNDGQRSGTGSGDRELPLSDTAWV